MNEVVSKVLSLFALVPVFSKKARAGLERPAVRLIIFFAALTAVVVFLMLGVSALLWQTLPLAQLAQFPWRLLTLSVVSMAFLCGAAAIGTRPAKGLVDLSTLILVALLILGSLPYMDAELSEQEVSIANLIRCPGIIP